MKHKNTTTSDVTDNLTLEVVRQLSTFDTNHIMLSVNQAWKKLLEEIVRKFY